MYKHFIKRLLDVLVSLILILILLPVLFVIAVLIWMVLKENPFFFQKRPGKNEIPFKLIKFKTMKTSSNSAGNLLPDEQRITKLGAVMRKYSLDEFPELLNVLVGEMSFVGPRPLLMQYLPYYSILERERHLVCPGITGLAQVSGRNFLDWDKRLSMDVEYVKNISFIMDAKIIGKTMLYVLMAKDVAVNPDEHEAYLDEIRSGKTNR